MKYMQEQIKSREKTKADWSAGVSKRALASFLEMVFDYSKEHIKN